MKVRAKRQNVQPQYRTVKGQRMASLAIKILRHRRRLGLSQQELARRAGIRVDTLNRIEHATHSPSVATVEKIEQALATVPATNTAPECPG